MTSSGSRVKRYFFDLDGTLFDTHALVVEAYRRAGVEMPPEAWGSPAHEWLPGICGSEHWKWVHEKKQVYYERLLRESPPARTTACRAMVELALSGVETYVLTGASRDAALSLLKGLQSYHYRLLGTDCDRDRKIRLMRTIGFDNAVYVDDDPVMCGRLREAGVPIVWYRFTMTKEEVMRPWLQSFSPPDVANG